MKRAVCLLSGGLDSVVSLAQGVKKLEVVMALTFDYGQRAVEQEIKSAERVCQLYGIVHRIIHLDWLSSITRTALVDKHKEIPRFEFGKTNPKESAKGVWVPNRNGIFINIGAAFAEGLDCQVVIAGFDQEEATFFPDNSIQFVEATNQALRYSTLNGVRVVSFVGNLNKDEIVRFGVEIKAPLSNIWSCYEGGYKMCGGCESCQRVIRAFKITNNWPIIEGRFIGG